MSMERRQRLWRLTSALLAVALVALGVVAIPRSQGVVTAEPPSQRATAAPAATPTQAGSPESPVAFGGAGGGPADAAEGVLLKVRPLVPARHEPSAPPSAPPPPYVLIIPVQGVSATELVDSFAQPRGAGRLHRAIDIAAPTGTPVLAAAAGQVVRMRYSARGGIALYILGEGGAFVYYYAHLDAFAEGLQEGDRVHQGQRVGYVGYTGNADASMPHLHFAIWARSPGSSRWGGRAVNPYPVLTRQASSAR